MIPKYRGWDIYVCDWTGMYRAIGPDYDASWEGEEDGWVDNGQEVEGKTIEEVKAEIDLWIEEN